MHPQTRIDYSYFELRRYLDSDRTYGTLYVHNVQASLRPGLARRARGPGVESGES